jgi:hypothetical protein
MTDRNETVEQRGERPIAVLRTICDRPDCQNPAVWHHMPSDGERCEAHVPRGCSCQEDDSGDPLRDDQGRLLPCCEWMEDE